MQILLDECIDLAIVILRPYRNKLEYLVPMVPQIKEILATIAAGQIKIISHEE